VVAGDTVELVTVNDEEQPRVNIMLPSWRSQKRRRYSSWLPGTKVTIVPARALDRILCTTSLCSCGQSGARLRRQKSMMSPTR